MAPETSVPTQSGNTSPTKAITKRNRTNPTDWFNEDDQVSYESDYDGWGYYDPYHTYSDRWDYGYDYGTDDYAYNDTTDRYWDATEGRWVSTDSTTEDRQQNQNTSTSQSSRNKQSASNQSSSMGGNQARRGYGDQSGDDTQQQIQNARFEGKIDGFKRVNLKNRQGINEKHSFVKIRLKNGQSRVVSLGTNVNVSDLDLEKGEQIKVAGEVARVAGRKLLLAEQMKVGDKMFQIKDQNQLAASGKNTSRTGGRLTSLDGQIEDFRKVSLGGSRDKNLIVRLQMKNGNRQLVDFGKNTELEDLDLDRGDRVRIKGERRSINGRTVIIARGITVDGERTQVRSDDYFSTGSES